MAHDEEYIDPHGECAAEISRLRSRVEAMRAVLVRARGELDRERRCCKYMGPKYLKLSDVIREIDATASAPDCALAAAMKER